MAQDRSFSLAVIDMAGTTVNEGALQEEAFTRALTSHGVEEGSAAFDAMTAYARRTSGTSKELVFRHLFEDAVTAVDVNRSFEGTYDALLAQHGVEPIPGAEESILALRSAGLKICLATGFGRHTQNMILESLGWMGLADLSLCPSDAGRGRPYPDIILTAVLALDIEDVRSVLVAGDTTSDILAGQRAGAGAVIGVLTGAHSEAELRLAGADDVLPSMCNLAPWLSSRPGSGTARNVGSRSGPLPADGLVQEGPGPVQQRVPSFGTVPSVK